MAKNVSNFTLGLFVVIGLFIGLAAVVWLGASRYFKTGSTYVTFFDESVQGLEVDSSVKYRGVDVGRVKKIEVAPDRRLIEVVMTIYKENIVRPDTIAQNSLTGLSGTSFVSLSPGKPEDLANAPRIDFPVRYQVIPSKPSQFKQIVSETEDAVENLKQFDFKGLSGQLKSATKSLEDLLSDPRLERIIAHLESASSRIDSTSQRIDEMVSRGEVEDILREAKLALADIRDLVSGTQAEIEAMDLPGTTRNADRLMDGLDLRTRRITEDIRSALESLEETSGSLDKLIGRLNANPSDIICSEPLPERSSD